MKVIYKTTAECPECGYVFQYDYQSWGEPYCPHCGLLLYWGETNGESEENDG